MLIAPFPDRAMIHSGNNGVELRRLAKQEHHVETLSINKEIFGCIYALVESRKWSDLGLIPGLDLANSAYGSDANIRFVRTENKCEYIASRNISPGEELKWTYNDSHALNTWLVYGYLDEKREYWAKLSHRFSQEDLSKFVDFASKKLGFEKQDIIPSSSIDPCLFHNYLASFGPKQTNIEDKRKTRSKALEMFDNSRRFFRIIALLHEDHSKLELTFSSLISEIPPFGLDIETRALALMQNALDAGILETLEISKKLEQKPMFGKIDFHPSVEIQKKAALEWKGTIGMLIELIKTETLDQATNVIAKHLSVTCEKSELRENLEKSYKDIASINCAIGLRHLKARNLI
jgi:hypothetical protein